MNIHNLTSDKRIWAFNNLGEYLKQQPNDWAELATRVSAQNSWFTPIAVQMALKAIAQNLNTEKLTQWLAPYLPLLDTPTTKTVGLVLAGNIPLVGFHDVLVALIAGFNVQIKLSSDDNQLIPFLLDKLIHIEPNFASFINYTDRLKNFDIVIATGSNNTSRYFEYYFREVPYIIRKNRNSVAVIQGNESKAQLTQLGHDLFDYFGLGCRNVSKLYVPEQYNFNLFFEAISSFSEVSHHHKYHNNYDYNKSIYLVNGNKHLDNGFLLLKEDERLASPLAVAYYQTYNHFEQLTTLLDHQKDQIQCVVSTSPLSVNIPRFPFGQSQQPALDDYADGVNTLDFLAQNR
ncbi:acyl-CoA reductase [Olivibacter ginsenosidimutans]|uniref:Acyl-CoA reductase n=1 Tax=Olivibacter ginsenosidimutans TaxID=1176537 RepID=A0ABP9C8X9_9SPHI